MSARKPPFKPHGKIRSTRFALTARVGFAFMRLSSEGVKPVRLKMIVTSRLLNLHCTLGSLTTLQEIIREFPGVRASSISNPSVYELDRVFGSGLEVGFYIEDESTFDKLQFVRAIKNYIVNRVREVESENRNA